MNAATKLACSALVDQRWRFETAKKIATSHDKKLAKEVLRDWCMDNPVLAQLAHEIDWAALVRLLRNEEW